MPIILSKSESTFSYGIGPALILLTHTDGALGSNAIGVGVTATYFDTVSVIFQHTYNAPLGLGIGKVLKNGQTVYHFYAEALSSIYLEGDMLPTEKIFFGINAQFL